MKVLYDTPSDDDGTDAFDTSWTYAERNGKPSPFQYKNPRYCFHCTQYGCHCRLQDCSHELCLEYTSKKDRKSLMRKYFSEEELERKNNEILEAHQTENRYCSCTWRLIPAGYPRAQEDTLSFCTVYHFEKILRTMIEEYHDEQEKQEKIELLEKYGLTLADYEEAKRTKALGI